VVDRQSTLKVDQNKPANSDVELADVRMAA
jgi:hypothetical protein